MSTLGKAVNDKEINDVEVNVYNRTNYKLEDAQQQPLLKKVISKWRQRNVQLFQHPTEPHKVLSVGTSFDGCTIIVCEEDKKDWARELLSAKDVVTTN